MSFTFAPHYLPPLHAGTPGRIFASQAGRPKSGPAKGKHTGCDGETKMPAPRVAQNCRLCGRCKHLGMLRNLAFATRRRTCHKSWGLFIDIQVLGHVSFYQTFAKAHQKKWTTGATQDFIAALDRPQLRLDGPPQETLWRLLQKSCQANRPSHRWPLQTLPAFQSCQKFVGNSETQRPKPKSYNVPSKFEFSESMTQDDQIIPNICIVWRTQAQS